MSYHELDFNGEVWNILEAAPSKSNYGWRHRRDWGLIIGRVDGDDRSCFVVRSRRSTSVGCHALLRVVNLDLLAWRHGREEEVMDVVEENATKALEPRRLERVARLGEQLTLRDESLGVRPDG